MQIIPQEGDSNEESNVEQLCLIGTELLVESHGQKLFGVCCDSGEELVLNGLQNAPHSPYP